MTIINHDFLNKLYESMETLDMKPVDRSLNKDKIQKFLNDGIFDDYDRSIIESIIKDTTYVNFEDFKRVLEATVDILLYKYDKYNLYFDLPKYKDLKNGDEFMKSEHWVTMLVWPKIKDRCRQVITSPFDDIKNNLPILVLDDCIYSGCHMCGRLDNFIYKYENHNSVKLKNKFIVLTPYAVHESEEFMKFNVLKFLNHTYKPRFNINDDYKLYEYLYEKFNCESYFCAPIYFDHKISNEFGSFPFIYENIVNNQPSRYKIEELNDKFKELYNVE